LRRRWRLGRAWVTSPRELGLMRRMREGGGRGWCTLRGDYKRTDGTADTAVAHNAGKMQSRNRRNIWIKKRTKSRTKSEKD